jgi:hypothetical protein
MSHSRPTAARPLRPAALLTLVALVAALFTAVIAPAGAAHAAAYRYWGYYHLDSGKWVFAQTGPDKFTPQDGALEGWRFAVGDESSTRLPRATPTFEDVCGATPAVAGKKRVGLVLDYGRPADAETGTPPAPTAKCSVVDTKATGAEVLAAVASVRSEGGLTCAIDSWPATGCGGEVKQVSAAAKAADTPVTIAAAKKADAPADAKASSGTSTSTLVLIGVIVLAALVVGAVALRRRSRA